MANHSKHSSAYYHLFADTFCGAIDKLEAELKNSGAKQTGETLKINILDHDIPEDPAEEWLGSWVNLLK